MTKRTLPIIPQPLRSDYSPETVVSKNSSPTQLKFAKEHDVRVEKYALDYLGNQCVGLINLSIEDASIDLASVEISGESYELRVLESAIEISAETSWGAIRGLASLWQIAKQGGLQFGLLIRDEPRFLWRGLMLDVARHFIPLKTLRETVDRMSLLKLNVLHLHLSDDQGFRFGSKKYPEVVSEDFYSLQELKSLATYCMDRGVRLIPEIDLPGHVTHIVASRPDLAPAGRMANGTQKFGVHKACLDPSNENVFIFVRVLIEELSDVFPDPFIHLGGDEVDPSWWSGDPIIKSFMKENRLSNSIDLQNYFFRRLVEIATALGKTVIGWDEVLHPEMPSCVVQNWRGCTTRDRARALGRDCIVSSPYYLDLNYPSDLHYQFDPQEDQNAMLEREDSLLDDPRLEHVAKAMEWTHQWREGAISLEDEEGTSIIGAEACLWSELVDANCLFARLWPRLPCLAERFWSAPSVKDINDFYWRLNLLMNLSEFNVRRSVLEKLREKKLSPEQCEAALFSEPTKWYSRLLGAEALASRISGTEMPISRPYSVSTKLNRIVDFLPSESLDALRYKETTDFIELKKLLSVALDHDWPEEEIRMSTEKNLEAVNLLSKYIDRKIEKNSVLRQLNRLCLPDGEYIPALPLLLKKSISENRYG